MAGTDFSIEGDKLKKLIKKSRAMPIPFGFNAGTSDDDDEYLAAHARKQPEVLGKLALSEGAGTKSAFGTFAVDGSEVHLTCFRSTPQLAKKFKKYLKRYKIMLNVVVMDPDGNMIDSDVETLDDWFRDEEDAEDRAEDAAEAVAEMVEEVMGATDEAPAAAVAVEGDAAALTARLKSLQPKISATPPAIAAKLAAAFKAAVMLVKAEQMTPAGATIAQIEAVLDKLASLPPAAPPAPAATAAAPATPDADPRLPRLREVVLRLSAQIAGALGAGAGPLLDELDRIEGLIDDGEAEAALTGLKAVHEKFKAA